MNKKQLHCCRFIILWWLLGSISSAKTTAHTEKVNLHLQQVPLHVALQALAEQQQLNLAVAPGISGTVTLRLVDLPWQQALDTILQLHGLSKTITSNVLLITKCKTPQQGTSPESTNQLPGKLTRHYFTIKHAKAADLAELLRRDQAEGLLSKHSALYVDERTNRILVCDEPKRIGLIKEFIQQFDRPICQVQLEARIVTISFEDLNQLGVRWGLGVPVREEILNGPLNPFSVHLPVSDAACMLGIQLAKVNHQQLDLELSALAQENRAEIIATPRLLTTNHQTATIKQGSEIPYTVNKGKGGSSLEFREVVLGLEATPLIISHDKMLIELKISQNSPGHIIKTGQGESISIDKQEIHTQVLVGDGETVVLGGVTQRSGLLNHDKVPLLGDLPIIGPLFGRKTRRSTKRELVIFITPKLLHNTSL